MKRWWSKHIPAPVPPPHGWGLTPSELEFTRAMINAVVSMDLRDAAVITTETGGITIPTVLAAADIGDVVPGAPGTLVVGLGDRDRVPPSIDRLFYTTMTRLKSGKLAVAVSMPETMPEPAGKEGTP